MINQNKIAIQKILAEDVKTAVFSSLELINAKQLMTKENMVVLLKPNVLGAKPPERAVTTHPEIIKSVIQWVKQFNPSKIYVCESSGGQQVGTTEKALKVSKILEVCESENVECIPFEKTQRKIYKIENPLVLEEFSASTLLDEADLIINLPKIKTHGQCVMTCCIKNMFGTMLLANKAKTHAQFPTSEKFNSALADIYSVSNPQLTVIDGYLCQEGNGPQNGDVVKMDIIMAGYDPVALDTAVCNIVGVDPAEVLHIGKAENKKLGTSDLKQVEILGETIENVYRKFKMPKLAPVSVPLPKWLADYLGRTIFKADVKFSSEKCKLCATCWENCPVKAIEPPKEMKKGLTPHWNKKKCITCYCCAELCPHNAVNLKINFAKNAIFSWIGVGLVIIIAIIIGLIIWLH